MAEMELAINVHWPGCPADEKQPFGRVTKRMNTDVLPARGTKVQLTKNLRREVVEVVFDAAEGRWLLRFERVVIKNRAAVSDMKDELIEAHWQVPGEGITSGMFSE